MKKWIPQVKKPFNPAYSHVWETMSKKERFCSLLFDVMVVIVVISAVVILEST